MTSAVTAYLTSKLKTSEEHKKWNRELALKYARVVNTNPAFAQNLAKPAAVGYLVIDEREGVPVSAEEPRKVPIPPNCRLVLGRSAPPADISVGDEWASMRHAAIFSDSAHVFVEDLGAKNGTWVNHNRVEATPVRLKDGDVVKIGSTRLRLQLHTK
ncbi:MAG: FHA domain-containing protein [Candidatus Korobacteraceae bacterium]